MTIAAAPAQGALITAAGAACALLIVLAVRSAAGWLSRRVHAACEDCAGRDR